MIPGNTELPPASLSPVLISSQHPIRCVMPAAFERAESCQAVPGQTPGCTSAPVASPAQELNNICYYTKACKILLGFLYVFEDFNVSSRKYLKQLHSLRLSCTICSPWAQISMCYRQRGFHLNTCSSIFSNSYATWGSISHEQIILYIKPGRSWLCFLQKCQKFAVKLLHTETLWLNFRVVVFVLSFKCFLVWKQNPPLILDYYFLCSMFCTTWRKFHKKKKHSRNCWALMFRGNPDSQQTNTQNIYVTGWEMIGRVQLAHFLRFLWLLIPAHSCFRDGENSSE